MAFRKQKITEIIKNTAASFIQIESNRTSLITVTGVTISKDEKSAVVLITVLPREKEDGVMDFLKRNRSEFKEYFRKHSRVARIPFFDFTIDTGEKNRQRIDELSNLG